ncbi:MAG: S1/P1 nuclease [Bacteroidota bacterium]
MNHKKISLSFVILFLVALISVNEVFAWNKTGHKVITAIAWDNLSTEARKNIIEVLKQAPANSDLSNLFDHSIKNAEKEWFMNASYWPDIVRDRKKKERWEQYHKGPWHYIGRYWKESRMGPVDVPDIESTEPNSIERLYHFNESLRSNETSGSDKAVQIAWVLHLVGDSHMPLHNASRVTKKHPDGDRGGNSFKLRDEWPKNLHAYWDGIIDVQFQLDRDQLQHKDYVKLAKKITKAHPKKDFNNKITSLDFNSWSMEGYEIVKSGVYEKDLKEGVFPSEAYQKYAFEKASARIALSGYRLAEMLNSIFG